MLKKLAMGLVTLAMTVLPLASHVAADTGTNLIANGSMETSASGIAPDGWLQAGWGTNTAAYSYETDGHTGRSIKTTISSYTDGDADWYFSDVAVTPGQTYEYSDWYKSTVDTEIDYQLTNTAGVVSYGSLGTIAPSTDWTQAKVTLVMPSDAKIISFFHLINKVGSLQVDDAGLATYTPSQFTRGIVALTFDDGWRDQYTNGRPLLNSYQLPVTYYLLTSTVTDPEYMTTDMMQTLGTEGNELASHTVTHPHLPTLTTAQVDQELSDAQTQLRAWFGTNGVADDFATPYGEYNSSIITEIKKYYQSHRSTDDGFNSKDNFDIYNIKVQNIMDATTPAQVQAWVNQAISDHTWLVLVYHRVGVDTAGTEDYGVTIDNLNTELSNLKASGAAVETVAQAIKEIQPQLNGTPATKPGDVNGDNTVDALDLSTVLSNWNKTGATSAQGDVNNDGTVDALDLSTVLANWSK